MFTGIIRHRGAVEQMTRSPSPRLVIRARGLRARRGDSVAVDGVCLTVAARSSGRLVFDLLGETLRATTLAYRKLGDRVNLEPSLRLGDQVGGHWVMGHVDGVGTVERVTRTSAGLTMVIRVPKLIRRYLAPKGAIAVDGVSLTVGPRLAWPTMTVFLVPHTAAVTTLGHRRPGDHVNLEVDPIARYVVEC